MNKDYKYIAFDAQYFLHRNFCALMSRTAYPMADYLTENEGDSSEGYVITKYEFNEMDLVKQFFWTIAKFIREKFSCEKIILLWDKPPYVKSKLLPDYKGDRVHHNQQTLDDWDIANDPFGYLQEKENYRIELIKQKAKYFIIDQLKDFGMISMIYDGYEADDLAWIFSHEDEILSGDRSALCSVDSDWLYWISDNVDMLNFNKNQVWTCQDVIDECEGKPTQLGLSLFETMQYMGSLYYSHNGLQKTSNLGWSHFNELVTEIKNKDYSHITDIDRFNLNMKSYEIWNYPNYEEVKKDIVLKLHQGKLGTVDEFLSLCSRYDLNISRSYYEYKYLPFLNNESYNNCNVRA